MSRVYFHLGFSIALFVIALTAYGLCYHGVNTLSARVVDLRAQVRARDQGTAAAKAAEAELGKLSDTEQAVRGYFVVTDNVVPFLEGLQALAAGQDADLAIVSVNANAAPRPHLDLSISIVGSFDAVMSTVGAVEYSPHDILVSNLTLSRSNTEEAGWTAAMTASVGTASSTTP